MDRKMYDQLESYMLSCMQDSAHDKDHVYRVLNNALMIAREEESADMDIVIAACLLHDVGRPEQMADKRLCHAQVGAEKAYAFLLAHGFDETKAEHIRRCIASHRYRKSSPPESLEAKILYDADKLDVTGAIGIARTLVYNGAVNQPIYSTAPDGSILDGSGDEPDSFCREYRYKLEKVYDRFMTDAGRRLALQRQAASAAFYDALMQEVAGDQQKAVQLLDLAIE